LSVPTWYISTPVHNPGSVNSDPTSIIRDDQLNKNFHDRIYIAQLVPVGMQLQCKIIRFAVPDPRIRISTQSFKKVQFQCRDFLIVYDAQLVSIGIFIFIFIFIFLCAIIYGPQFRIRTSGSVIIYSRSLANMQISHNQVYKAQLTLSVYPPVQHDTVRNTGSVNPNTKYCIHESTTLHTVYGSVCFTIKNVLIPRGAAGYAAVPYVVRDPYSRHALVRWVPYYARVRYGTYRAAPIILKN
jgi:hypothetical protein